MSEEVKSLEDQLQDQKQSLEENIRQTEVQMGRLKEKYLKTVLKIECTMTKVLHLTKWVNTHLLK